MRPFNFLLGASLILAGCCTPNPDAANEKLESTLKQNGYKLEPISMDLAREKIWDDYSFKSEFMKALQNKFATNQDLVAYLSKCLATVEQFHKGDLELINTLENRYDGDKDVLFYYEQVEKVNDDKDWAKEDDGWMIIENGQIKLKLSLGSGRVYQPSH